MKDPKTVGGWEWHYVRGGIGIGNAEEPCLFWLDNRYMTHPKAKRCAEFIVAQLNATEKWRVADSAQRESRLEFLAWDGEHCFVAHWNSGEWWSDGRVRPFTHWMPLPSPPQNTA